MTGNATPRESILAIEDLRFEEVTEPTWNFKGFVRELDGDSRFRLSTIASRQDDNTNVHIVEAYVCEGLYDENKERVFSIDDRHELAKKNPDVILRIYRKILKLSKMDQESVDEIEKKSERATA